MTCRKNFRQTAIFLQEALVACEQQHQRCISIFMMKHRIADFPWPKMVEKLTYLLSIFTRNRFLPRQLIPMCVKDSKQGLAMGFFSCSFTMVVIMLGDIPVGGKQRWLSDDHLHKGVHPTVCPRIFETNNTGKI